MQGSEPPSTKLKFELTVPKHDARFAFLATDFPKYVASLNAVARKAPGPKKGNAQLPVRIPSGRDPKDISVTHKLMMKKDVIDVQVPELPGDAVAPGVTVEDDGFVLVEGADADVQPAAPPPLFSVKGWPASKRWHDTADPLADGFDIVPFPAFDVKGDLMEPKDYERLLPGAIVKADLNFVSYVIAGKVKVLVAELQELHVLVEAPVRNNTALKRKMQLVNDALAKKVCGPDRSGAH
ncbi:hypothetical protein SCHPADRAFT_121669 [Schizopora paradoxa]|uniref:Uncharacterized protein n=1 Tax=Schizopora paradoxa TaxID=27342 RepID=A0A0H2S9E0_9AGAM|nr:hypothetical protein SCHPADRAFT_121669 [Schizopora paradoxa]